MDSSINIPAISIKIEGDPILLILKSANGKVIHIATKHSLVTLGNLRNYFAKALEKIKNCWAVEINPGSGKSYIGVDMLIREMGGVLFQLTLDQATVIRDFCREAVPTWNSCTSQNYQPAVIEIIADSHLMFPVDMLPLFGFDEPKGAAVYQLHEAVSQIPAFSCIVKRMITNHPQSAREILNAKIDNDPNLNLRFFQYAKNWELDKEVSIHRSYSNLDFRGPWPNSDMRQTDFEIELSHMLFNGKSLWTEEIDHIQHFSCHYYNMQMDPDEDHLKLGHYEQGMLWKKLVEKTIKIKDIQINFLRNLPRPAVDSYPLVFINACASARNDLLKPYSLTELLLSMNNRGVIGTEASIPETFASLFSRDFYIFLSEQKSVGEAIFLSKWNQIKKHNNYLGFLYCVYANVDLRLKNQLRKRA